MCRGDVNSYFKCAPLKCTFFKCTFVDGTVMHTNPLSANTTK